MKHKHFELKDNIKRIITFLMIIVVLFSSGGTSTFASDDTDFSSSAIDIEDDEICCSEESKQTGELQNPVRHEDGSVTYSTVYFGNYWQSDTNGDGYATTSDEKQPIKWRVLQVTENDLFLLADENLDCKKFHEGYDTEITWENCTLRAWLNDEFLNNAFNENERNAIKTSTIKNARNIKYRTNGGNNTTDKIFILSESEINNTNYGFSADRSDNDLARRGYNTPFADIRGASTNSLEEYLGNGTWWLRTPGERGEYTLSVSFSGSVASNGYYFSYDHYAVRPALHIPLSSSLYTVCDQENEDNMLTEEDGGTYRWWKDDEDKNNSFSGSIAGKDGIPWKWSLFNNDARAYNQELALFSLYLSSRLAYGDVEDPFQFEGYSSTKQGRIIHTLEDFGMDKVECVRYLDELNRLPAVVFAHATVELQGQEKNVFFIIPRGTNSTGDVFTDIDAVIGGLTGVGGGTQFQAGAIQIKQDFENYLSENGFQNYNYYCEHAEDNILLITGHSLGAAAANYLAMLLDDFAIKKQSFVYTFAAPRPFRSLYDFSYLERDFTNVYNIVNVQDAVTAYLPNYFRIGHTLFFSSEDKEFNIQYKTNVDNKEFTGKYIEIGKSNHLTPAYLAGVLANGNDWKGPDDKVYAYCLSVLCPVDIDIYDHNNQLIGRVSDNKVDYSIDSKTAIFVDVDEKWVYLPIEENYTVKLTGTDEGTMTYGIQQYNACTDELIDSKLYQNVVLSKGKTMVGEVTFDEESSVSTNIVSTTLFVVDEEGNKIKEIDETGEESLCTVSANKVLLDKTNIEMTLGQNPIQLIAAIEPNTVENLRLIWNSSDNNIATVSDKGVITAIGEGTVVISVNIEGTDLVARCEVIVKNNNTADGDDENSEEKQNPVNPQDSTDSSVIPEKKADPTIALKDITFNSISVEVIEGESIVLAITYSPENATNKKVSWSSSDTSVVTVVDGNVTAVKEGKATIKAISEDGNHEAVCEVTVKKKEIHESPLGPDKPDLSKYTASGNEIAVKSINLKKTIFNGMKGIKKYSVTGDIAAVKIKGSILTVLKDGTVTITATNKAGDKLAEKTITVIAPAVESAQPTEINRRGNLDMNKYINSTVQPYKWKSSSKKIAEVDQYGLLQIKKSGKVKITATFPSEKGMKAKTLTIKLNIKMPQFKKTKYTVKVGKTANTAVKNANASDIIYRVENEAIATVDAQGKVTGVSQGTTKLIMTVKQIDYETVIKVK